MSSILASTLPYMLSESLLFEYATPGMYMWSLLPSLISLIVLLYFKKTELEWKRDLIIQPLCAFVAYVDLVSEMETYETPIATIQPKTQSVWQGLVAITLMSIISLSLRRKKVITLFEKDFAPPTTIAFGHIAITIVAIVQAFMSNQIVTRTFVADMLLLFAKEQLQYRDVSIPLIVASTCFYRFLLTADWRCVNNINDMDCIHGDSALKAIGMGIVVVIMLYSLVYLCQKSSIYVPAIITSGSRIALQKRFIPDTMMGTAVMIVAYFHWYFEDELTRAHEPINGEIIQDIIVNSERNDETGYSSIEVPRDRDKPT